MPWICLCNPPARLERLLKQEINRNGRTAIISAIPAGSVEPTDSILLLSEPSKSMHHLLSLANGESHNFTAEVLLREGTGSWQLPITQRRAMEWLQQQGLPVQGVVIQDGSGLDRGNRITSKLLLCCCAWRNIPMPKTITQVWLLPVNGEP